MEGGEAWGKECVEGREGEAERGWMVKKVGAGVEGKRSVGGGGGVRCLEMVGDEQVELHSINPMPLYALPPHPPPQ